MICDSGFVGDKRYKGLNQENNVRFRTSGSYFAYRKYPITSTCSLSGD